MKRDHLTFVIERLCSLDRITKVERNNRLKIIEAAIRMAYDPDMDQNEFLRLMDELTYGCRVEEWNLITTPPYTK